MSSSGNGERPTVPPEYDGVRRKAKVSLYDYDTTGVGMSSTDKHWALVFEFEDEAVRVIEGINFRGRLLPSFTKVKDPSVRFNSRKGSVTISPKKIRDLALNNPYNNKTYNVITCNCQNWVNAILERLGFAKDTTVGDETGWTLASIAAVVTGIFIGRRIT
ncbi:uncharacterized protein [Rhodnius prolixus]|uniref:uncharacterized protein n=1 Tax=Rhodnius prolixus TaxID=13249 RepID=UPI003D18C7C5